MNTDMKSVIDRETFRGILNYYGVESSNGDSLSDRVVDMMLDSHVSEKYHIFKLFGNKLKIEKEIETTVGANEASAIRKALINELDEEKLIFVRGMLKAISIEEFIENKLDNQYQICDVKFTKGTKLSKALAKLCLKSDVHRVTTALSMAIQKMSTKGKAVLSIDPIDYITMSSNSSGWRSCHRLDGGEFRTGPLAYLNDSSSVICYIESSTPCTIKREREFIHSNKTWRQIALVSPDLEFAIQERQYPSSNTINSESISNMFVELFNKENNTDAYKFSNEEVDVLNDLHVDYSDHHDVRSLYYNDMTNEMFGTGTVVYATDTINPLYNKELPIKGQEAYCLSCGATLYEPDDLYCDNCDSGYDDEDYDDYDDDDDN